MFTYREMCTRLKKYHCFSSLWVFSSISYRQNNKYWKKRKKRERSILQYNKICASALHFLNSTCLLTYLLPLSFIGTEFLFRHSCNFMEAKLSLRYSWESAICPIPNWLNPDHSCKSCFFKISFNVILASTPKFPEMFLPWRFSV